MSKPEDQTFPTLPEGWSIDNPNTVSLNPKTEKVLTILNLAELGRRSVSDVGDPTISYLDSLFHGISMAAESVLTQLPDKDTKP